ncbi:MAG: DUF1624 domain-containing protein [Oscillospiraceae bacterium]|jgi:uncharacterized membrane protein|nr:DUF1624 domain-containing protein [Oscillospiraceae bacterium]
MKKERIELIDALRGLAALLMVIHHALFDLVEFLGAPEWLFSNPVFNFLHYIFAGVFILLAGVSSRFSHSNLKRGGLTALAALAVTGASYLVGEPIKFGVLHLLASCMLLYAARRRPYGGEPFKLAGVAYVLLIVLSALAVRYMPIHFAGSWILGWTGTGFYSADYFPLLPWVFVFLLGAWAGYYVRERRLPEWFYTLKIPFFPSVGRKSLFIYLAHQPALYGLVLLILHAR